MAIIFKRISIKIVINKSNDEIIRWKKASSKIDRGINNWFKKNYKNDAIGKFNFKKKTWGIIKNLVSKYNFKINK